MGIAKYAAGCLVYGLMMCLSLSGCDKNTSSKTASESATKFVAKVTSCAAGDRAEPALQGQIPAAVRANGFNGYNCNLALEGQVVSAAGVGLATFKDDHGHFCAYFSAGLGPNGSTDAVDITNPANPVVSATLTTPAMAQPRETLRVNARRQLLAAFKDSKSDFDIYDLSEDCRTPKLLASLQMEPGVNGGLPDAKAVVGHDANFSVDGLTYYDGEGQSRTYTAIDVSDPTKPKVVSQVDLSAAPLARPGFNGFSHGLSLSDDGNRAYVVSIGLPTAAQLASPDFQPSDGIYVLDTSEVQARKLNAQMKVISSLAFRNGSAAQHTLAIKIAGKPYAIFVDEVGGGGIPGMASGGTVQQACDAGLTPFPMGHIIDVSDETKPKLVAELGLETHDVANCSKVAPDTVGEGLFVYGSHICSVDNRENATALACGYWESGIRVFDIRDPTKPKEIAYFNPAPAAGVDTKLPAGLGPQKPTVANSCGAPAGFDFDRKLLISQCMRSGLMVLKFENGVWPFPETTPADRTVGYN
jgi:hypothetical protein